MRKQHHSTNSPEILRALERERAAAGDTTLRLSSSDAQPPEGLRLLVYRSVPRQSVHEAKFALLMRAHRLDDGMVAEHRFHGTRRWRFDFAWPDRWFAVEVDGIGKAQSRHRTLTGILGDAEKFEAALLGGWQVYRVPAPWLDSRPDQIVATVRDFVG